MKSGGPTKRLSARKGIWLLSLVGVTLLINLPIAQTAWNRHKLSTEGITTYAEVTHAEGVPKDDPQLWFVRFRLPEDVDAEKREFSAEVTEATYDQAVADDRLEVTYLEDDPQANTVEGAVERSMGLWLVAFADVALLLMFALYLAVGRNREKALVLLATADVRRCAPGHSITEVPGGEYLVTGDVVEIEDDAIVVESEGGRRVRLVLGDHTNEVGYQQPVEIRGRELS